MKKQAVFLTVEGVEGVGKTTNVGFIKSLLERANIDFVSTREPGGTPLAEELRDVLLQNREELVNGHAEMLMVFAARAQHLNQFILPALAKGQWVVCDRFTDATYAYQGCGRDLGAEDVLILEKLVQRGRQPDLTIYLDLDVEIGLQRASKRGELDRFENENRDFFEKVRQGYLDRVAADPGRFVVIDASQPLEKVQEDIRQALKHWIGS